MSHRHSFFPRLLQDDLTLHVQKSVRESIDSIPGLAKLLGSFENATGWSLSYHELPAGHSDRRNDSPVGQPFSVLKIDDLSMQIGPDQRAVSRTKCDEVISAVDQILNHLHEIQTDLRHRSAELATNIPVIRKGGKNSVAELLESLLRSAGQLINADAAAIYLLDDTTTKLDLRVSIGLPASRLSAPARPLERAAGDLEALVGHAVIVKDAAAVKHWNIPEKFNSAVCLPISTPTVPLGTMWLFANSLREITDADTNILDIIAGRIAAEMEREAILNNAFADKQDRNDLEQLLERYLPTDKDRRLLQEIVGESDDVSRIELERAESEPGNSQPIATEPTDEEILASFMNGDEDTGSLLLDDQPGSERDAMLDDPAAANDFEADNPTPQSFASDSPFTPRDVERAVRWQKRTEPVMMPMLDGWQIGGRVRSVQTLNCAFNGWQVLPDSRIAFFLGDSSGEGIEAALTAASLRTSIKALANQMLAPHILMERINETLWHDEMGDQFISLICGMIDPATGRLEYCSAGNPGAFMFDSYGDRNMLEHNEPVGTDIDAVFQSERHHLLPGQSLFLYNDGLRQICPTSGRDYEDERLFEMLNMVGGADLGTLNEWIEGRFANRTVASRRAPADAAFTLLTRLQETS